MTRRHSTPHRILIALTLLATPPLRAQVPTTIPTFEVSTVKPSSSNASSSDLNEGPYNFSTRNVPLDAVIQFAWNLNNGSDDQIVGAPAWLRTSKFDITTKASDPAIAQLSKLSSEDRVATIRLMVQALLADRFHLKLHHETRSLPVIVLTLANPAATTDPHLTPSPDRSTSNDWSGLHNSGEGHVEVRGEPLRVFADFLGVLPEINGRMVLDHTGLTGNYDFTLNWTPQQLDQDAVSPAPTGPTLFAALTEQLGLKLKSTRAPIDVLVIDHIDPPTAN